jgi:hypothetical protein
VLKWKELAISRKFVETTPKGTRTPVLAVRGLCPRPLDDGGLPPLCIAVDSVLVKLWKMGEGSSTNAAVVARTRAAILVFVAEQTVG